MLAVLTLDLFPFQKKKKKNFCRAIFDSHNVPIAFFGVCMKTVPFSFFTKLLKINATVFLHGE